MIRFGRYKIKNFDIWRYLDEEEIRELIKGSRPWGLSVFGGLLEVTNSEGKKVYIISTESPKVYRVPDFLREEGNPFTPTLWFRSVGDYFRYYEENKDKIEIRNIQASDMVEFCNSCPLILVKEND